MRESTKAYLRRRSDPFWNEVFVGDGLDVGSGDDPFRKEWFPGVRSMRTFDLEDGDAQYLARKFPAGSFDFVHSSNCLEHMAGVWEALLGWLHVLKPGGHLVFTVPDEDLYEQGVFPSRWNPDHKWTFALNKESSWSQRSVNLAGLAEAIGFCEERRIVLADSGYDRSVSGVDQTMGAAEAFWEVVLRKTPVERRKRTFRHSGARGDLVYGLSAVKAMGGGTLYLNRGEKCHFGIPMGDAEFEGVRRFLKAQPYVDEVLDWKGEPVDCDMDEFRRLRLDYNLLSDAQQMCFGVSNGDAEPWLEAEPVPAGEIVVGRSERYHGPFDWDVLRPWTDRCVFVGSKAERDGFMERTGMDIRLADTPTWAELAGVIRAAKLFVGNQSLAYSMAEAMKVPRVLETYAACPNCDPRGSDCQVVLTKEMVEGYLEGKGRAEGRRESRNPWRMSPFQVPRRSKELPSFAVVVPACAGAEAVARTVESLKGAAVVVQSEGSSFEEMANLGAARTDAQIVCVLDAGAGFSLTDVEAVVGQMLSSRVGMAGSCVSVRFGAHVSGPCFAVSRRAYEQMGLFSPAMRPGAVNMLEMNLRYAKGRYGCKSAALRGMMGWEECSVPEWDEPNLRYVERTYGVKT